ncbi:Breast cancer type 1 susceptibility -like protein [Halotydeus destructor]|nr:Breast cancer type 1 susceptibility -like protein [Halotydeus destructor]
MSENERARRLKQGIAKRASDILAKKKQQTSDMALIVDSSLNMEPDQIDRIRHVLAKMKKTVECPICFDYLDSPVKGNCDHHFCLKCIEKHIDVKTNGQYKRTSGKSQCPVCQKQLDKRSLRTVEQLEEAITNSKNLVEKFESMTKKQVLRISDGPLIDSQVGSAFMELPSTKTTAKRKTSQTSRGSLVDKEVRRHRNLSVEKDPLPEKVLDDMKNSETVEDDEPVRKSGRNRKRKDPFDFDAKDDDKAEPPLKVKKPLAKKPRGKKTPVIEDETDEVKEPAKKLPLVSPAAKPKLPKSKVPDAKKSTESTSKDKMAAPSEEDTAPILKVANRRKLPVMSPRNRDFETPALITRSPVRNAIATSTPALSKSRPPKLDFAGTPVKSVTDDQQKDLPSPILSADDEPVLVPLAVKRTYMRHTPEQAIIPSPKKASLLFDKVKMDAVVHQASTQTDATPDENIYNRLSALFNALCQDKGVEGSITIEGIGKFEIALRKADKASKSPLDGDDIQFSQVVMVTSDKGVQVDPVVAAAVQTRDQFSQCSDNAEDSVACQTRSEAIQTDVGKTMDAGTFTEAAENFMADAGTQTIAVMMEVLKEKDARPPSQDKNDVIELSSQENGARKKKQKNGEQEERQENVTNLSSKSMSQEKTETEVIETGPGSQEDEFMDDDDDFYLQATLPGLPNDIDGDMSQFTQSINLVSQTQKSLATDKILDEIIPESDPEEN